MSGQVGVFVGALGALLGIGLGTLIGEWISALINRRLSRPRCHACGGGR